MSVKPALTAGEITALAGPTTLRRYLKAAPATVIATARVNQSVFGYPLAQITVDTTSAGWSNVRPGMTLYIGSSSGAHDKGIYRVRLTPGASTLYIGEMGQADPGMLPVDLYNTLIVDNDYITVYDRYDVWSVLPRIVYPDGSTIYEDYDLAVGTYNTTPPPIVNVTINGVSGHYGKYITTANHALTCVVTCTQWVAQTYTYAWSYPAGWTGVSGSTTATLTATATPGDYTVACTVTPNVGNAIRVVRHIFICDATTNPPIVISEMPEGDTRDRTGRRMIFNLYNNALASIPDGAMIHYWEEATWNATTVSTATTSFTGWVLKQTRQTDPGLRSARIEVVGPTGLMALLNGTSQIITAAATADTWQKVVPALSSASFLAWYILSWRAGNLLKLFNFTTFSVSASGQRLPEWRLDKGTLLQQIQQLATERGNFGANSQGEMFFLRHPSMTAYSGRTAGIVQRDTLTSSLFKSVTIEQRRYKLACQIRGEAFSWDGSAALPTPLLSDAPFVPGQGGAAQKLTSQVVDSQSTLDQLTGDYWAFVNNPFPDVSVTIEKNRDVYEPAELPFVTVTVSADLSPDGVQWSKRCVPRSVTKNHIDSAADIIMSLEAETAGMAGIPIAVPVENTSLVLPDTGYPDLDTPITDLFQPSIPLEPPVITDPSDPGGTAIKTDGSFAWGCTATKVYRTCNFLEAAPTYEDITPSGPTDFQMILTDPASTSGRGGYALGNDGTDSTVSYCADIGAETPVWTTGASASGIYTKIVAFKGQAGKIEIYSPASGWTSTSITVDFDSGYAYTLIYGTLTSGGNPGNCIDGGASSSDCPPTAPIGWTWCEVKITLPVTGFITGFHIDIKASWAGYTGPVFHSYDADDNLINTSSYTIVSSTSWITYNYTGLTISNVAYVKVIVAACGAAGFNVYMDNIVIDYQYPDPSGNAAAAYSGDYGATLDTPDIIGSALIIGGFDGTRYGDVTVAASSGQVKRATALGGAYSAITGLTESALSILVPWWQIGSTSNANNSATTPDFLMGGSFGLNKVVSGVAASIDPAVGATIAVANALTSWKGRWFACIAEVSGNRNLYITTTTGASWTLIGGANGAAGALSVRVRRNASTPGQLIVACGANGVKYYTGSGTSLTDKGAPTGTHRSWEMLG